MAFKGFYMNKVILILLTIRYLVYRHNLFLFLILAKYGNNEDKEDQDNYYRSINKCQINRLIHVIEPISKLANFLTINPVHEFKLTLIIQLFRHYNNNYLACILINLQRIYLIYFNRRIALRQFVRCSSHIKSSVDEDLYIL